MSADLASDYDRDMNPVFFGIRAKIIKRLINGHKPKKALDIGCGTGVFLDYFHNDFKAAIGIDRSEVMINFAGKNHKRKNIKYILGNDAPLPFDENSFDLVLSMGILEYSKNQKKHVDEALRVLKKNGILFLTTPTKMMNIYMIARVFGLAAARYWKISKYLSFGELEKLIDEDSAEIVEHKVLFFNPSGIRLFDIFFNAVSRAASGKLNRYLFGPQYIIVRKK